MVPLLTIKPRSNAAHHVVLGLIGSAARLTAPAAHDQHGDSERRGQRGEGVDRIPETGVLENCNPTHAAKIGSSGDGESVALVGRPDVTGAFGSDRGVDQRGKIRARDAGDEPESGAFECGNEVFSTDHGDRHYADTVPAGRQRC